MTHQLFARLEGYGAPFPVTVDEAKKLNEKHYGIHHMVNRVDMTKVDCTGRGRSVENITDIYSWCVESDSLSLEEQWKRINAFGVDPSLIVRSKNSYHVYFRALDGTKAQYKFIQTLLAKFFDGDMAITHAAVTLRTPGFMHWKDKEDPFPVEAVYKSKAAYKEWSFKKICLLSLGLTEADFDEKADEIVLNSSGLGGTDIQIIDSVNQADILTRLSGAEELSGSAIRFRRNSNGNMNIWVNGKPTPAFIDRHGRIGSAQGGGPSSIQWVTYYGYSVPEAIKIIQKYVPELWNDKAADTHT